VYPVISGVLAEYPVGLDENDALRRQKNCKLAHANYLRGVHPPTGRLHFSHSIGISQ
jgi:hypothetical protein